MLNKLEKSLQEAWKKIEENTLIDTNSLGKPIADSPEKLVAFWKWFKGSKIVDEQGRPIVVHHGTKTDFDNFDLNKIGLNGLALGPGFYFTDSVAVAHGYGDVKSFYLRALNPTLSNEKKTITKAQVLKIIQELQKEDSDFLSNYGDASYDGHQNIIRLALDDMYNTSESDSDIIGSIITVGMIDRNRVMEIIKTITKKDAFIAKASLASHAAGENDKMYVVVSPSQVKSVNTKGTFSNLVNESNSSFKVPLDSLYSPKWKIVESYKEILKVELSKTDGPIKVSKIGRNKFFIIDGNHRTIEAILNSESSLMATLDEFYPDLTKTGGAFNSVLEQTVQVTKYLKSIS
jgi:hypothetical protein